MSNDINLLTPFAIIWKLSRQNIIDKITSFPLTPRLYEKFQKIAQDITWRIRTLWNVIRATNRREGFKAMNAKVIVLLKRDLNYKLRLISNEDWGKKVWIILLFFRGSFVVRFPLLMTSFQFVSWISSYFILTWLLARYSPLYLCLFLLFCAFRLPYSVYFSVLSNFLVRFSRLALRLLLLAFFDCCLLLSSLFHSKPFLHELEL